MSSPGDRKGSANLKIKRNTAWNCPEQQVYDSEHQTQARNEKALQSSGRGLENGLLAWMRAPRAPSASGGTVAATRSDPGTRRRHSWGKKWFSAGSRNRCFRQLHAARPAGSKWGHVTTLRHRCEPVWATGRLARNVAGKSCDGDRSKDQTKLRTQSRPTEQRWAGSPRGGSRRGELGERAWRRGHADRAPTCVTVRTRIQR